MTDLDSKLNSLHTQNSDTKLAQRIIDQAAHTPQVTPRRWLVAWATAASVVFLAGTLFWLSPSSDSSEYIALTEEIYELPSEEDLDELLWEETIYSL